MRRLTSLLTALLLPVAQPLLLGTAVTSGALLVYLEPAQAQSAEAVAKVAQAITVRIEGATQGSGVLVKRDGNRYTVLSAWHVVSGQRPGEELDIFTPDGQRHKLEQGSIKRLGEVDMAVLNFSSSRPYELATIGDVKSVNRGDQVLVAGFPVGSNGRLKYNNGNLVANAAVGIDQGYQLLYTNETDSGMSGGVVLKADGTLIGMHGRGELDELQSQQSALTIKTGTNQGVPIAYYSLYIAGSPVVSSSSQASTADDYLAKAKALLGKRGSEQEVISLTNRALAIQQSPSAHLYQGISKFYTKDTQGAIQNFSRAIKLESKSIESYKWRGIVHIFAGESDKGCPDLRKAVALGDPDMNSVYGRYCQQAPARANALIQQERREDTAAQAGQALLRRGEEKFQSNDTKGAIEDYSRAIALNPQNAEAYYRRCYARWTMSDSMSDRKSIIADCSRAAAIRPELSRSSKLAGILSAVYAKLGDTERACGVLRSAGITNSMYFNQICK
jgi:tetratricopeptide (TPR) repeat protein